MMDMFQDWGDWMCLVQDDVDFEKAEEHINVEVGKEAVTSLTWGGHQHDHDLGNKIENGTRYLRVIEDTVTRVECRVTRAVPRPTTPTFHRYVRADNSGRGHAMIVVRRGRRARAPAYRRKNSDLVSSG